MPALVVSSPGKVLLAGGYLVLDPTYPGVVVSTSSRFYTVIDSATGNANGIVVRSPQFENASWAYTVQINGDNVVVEQTSDPSSKNKFVELALNRTLGLICEIKGGTHVEQELATGLDIVIAGGNDFYSQRAKLAEANLPATISSLAKLEPFGYLGVRLTEVHKTGLGSSAALITSLVTALLLRFSVITHQDLEADESSEGRRLAHNVSQYVHCLAQGKVGSGFDVSSAVFGSQIYTRFAPGVIQPLIVDDLGSQPMLPVLSPANNAWDYRVEPFKLPPMTRLMLADVDAGSDTPSLVGKVLKWRQADKVVADALWDTLTTFNISFSKALTKLSSLYELNGAAYSAAVTALSTKPAVLWEPSEADVEQTFLEVYRLSENIRAKMREMGELAGVPIEPPEQTNLISHCLAQGGVIAGGVPGAGGYDALWLLVFEPEFTKEDDETPLKRVEKVWLNWTELRVSPLSATESRERGVRVEQLGAVPGLEKAVARRP